MPIDKTKYPPNWDAEIRPRILKRAKNCCEKCGLKNYSEGIRTTGVELASLDEYMIDHATQSDNLLIEKYGPKWNTVKQIKIVLTIAHLDHDESNWNVTDDRLMAMCQRCHLRYDAPEKARRKRENKQQIKLF